MTTLLMPSAAELQAALPDVRVEREIRRAGQRTVYKVEILGEHRVLKLMYERDRNRAEREVVLGRDFDHPNLARILDRDLNTLELGTYRYVFFTEEFVDGVSLDHHPNQLDPCEVLQLGADLLSAVDYLWARGVVHRDIKPANIMVRPSGGFTLLDVGVGRHVSLDTITSDAMPHGPGTQGYLAPEQLQPAKGRELDDRADQFAVGIVLFEQLAGELPFDPSAGSYRTLLMAGVFSMPENLPSQVESLIRRLLAPKPHGRYRSSRAVAAVREAQEALGCS